MLGPHHGRAAVWGQLGRCTQAMPAADHTAQVSLVSILPRTCMVQGLHSGTNQPCYELDWDKG